MRIGFIVARPTQFEVPFYRFVSAQCGDHTLHVFYLEKPGQTMKDLETGQLLTWGKDIYQGYPHDHLTGEHAATLFEKHLDISYDLVILNGYKQLYDRLLKVCKLKGIPVALRMDTVLFNRSLFEVIGRRLLLKPHYRKFDRYLVTGKATTRYLLTMGISPDKIGLFSYCTDNDVFRKNAEDIPPVLQHLAKNDRVILVVSKFIPRENPLEALRAFCSLHCPELILVIVGAGKQSRRLKKYAARFPRLQIIFPGYVPYADLPAYYHRTTVFIHPARYEPWGVSVQEAIAGGCRVICSNKVGSAEDLIVTGKNGFIYPSGNIQALREKIIRTLAIPHEIVSGTNRMILSKWNYACQWEEILNTAQQVNLLRTIPRPPQELRQVSDRSRDGPSS